MTDIKRSKIKMIHEEVFEKFNINPEEHYTGKSSKPIPNEWYYDIILKTIHSVTDYKFESFNYNKLNKLFIINFENKILAETFNKKLNQKIFICMNEFIREEKKYNPKDYNRTLVLSSEVNGSEKGGILQISY